MTPRILIAAAVTSTLVLSACGGSGGSGGSGTPASTAGTTAGTTPTAGTAGVSQGTVTGFGSVIVDGERITDTGASVEAQGDKGLAAKGTSTDLKLGQRVQVERDANGAARTIRIAPELIGAVSALDATARSLTVNGMTVVTNADASAGPVTAWSGYGGFADVKTGDRVEVHGYPVVASTGTVTLRATRIEQRPAATAALVSGVVSGWSAGAGTFTLGGLTVTVNAGTQLLPAGATIADGEYVGVLASGGVSGNALTATAVRVRKASSTSTTIRSAGVVTDFTAGTGTFKLAGLPVDAGAAKVNPPTATLGNNLYVVVTGSYDATANALKATEVNVLKTPATPPVELHGTISDFVDTAHFKVRGVLVDASAATVTGGTLAALADNVGVEVHGTIVDSIVKAGTIEIQPVAGQSVVDFAGIAVASNAGAGTLTLRLPNGSTVTAAVGQATTFQPAGKTLADIAAGTLVKVQGSFSGNAFNASSVALWDPPVANALTVQGVVGQLQPATGTPLAFVVENLLIRVGTATLPAGFGPGVKVKVQFTRTGDLLTATSIALAN